MIAKLLRVARDPGRVLDRAGRPVQETSRRLADLLLGSHAALSGAALVPRIDRVCLPAGARREEILFALADEALAHRFDLLGSGWIEIKHGMQPDGFLGNLYDAGPCVPPDPAGAWLRGRINRSNLAESQRIWSLVDPPYTPVDWQLDFRSGYRWNERRGKYKQRYGHLPGVDIKMPWELARMYHLPRLALAYALRADRGECAIARRYCREFQNQVLDFLATNPPRFGVNWVCSMDASIRAANWALAWDLFRSVGARFDKPFESQLARGLAEHGRHVRANLEWNHGRRGNHYLANLAGLLFVSAYLPAHSEFVEWRNFAARQLVSEVEHQFLPEGANFEGSTCYHRLSTEMVYFSAALLLGLGWDFPPWFADRLRRAGEFARHITTPDGSAAQFGDNDSGRFFALNPPCTRDTEGNWRTNDLDHSHLLDACVGLFGKEGSEMGVDGAVIRALARGRPLRPPARAEPVSGFGPHGEVRVPAAARLVARVPVKRPVERFGYPAFGLFVFRNDDLFLAIRCGGRHGSHAHDDHLAVELFAYGDWIARDPGTFTYTASPRLRALYRSCSAHCAPAIEETPDSGRGVFEPDASLRSECLYFGAAGFAGETRSLRKIRARRYVMFCVDSVEVWDESSRDEPVAQPLLHSPGYGKQSSLVLQSGWTGIHAELNADSNRQLALRASRDAARAPVGQPRS